MDLVAFLFRFSKRAGSNDAAAGAVCFQGARQCIGCGQPKHCLQHFDDVIDGVIFVIKDNDMIEPFSSR